MEFYHYGLKICRYIFAVLKREFTAKEDTPIWCIELARKEMFKTLYSLMEEITFANDTYIINKETYMERRNHITRAIGYCDYLLVQLTLIGELFNFDYDKYEYIILDIEKEIYLLKGLRKSDNKVLKNLGFTL